MNGIDLSWERTLRNYLFSVLMAIPLGESLASPAGADLHVRRFLNNIPMRQTIIIALSVGSTCCGQFYGCFRRLSTQQCCSCLDFFRSVESQPMITFLLAKRNDRGMIHSSLDTVAREHLSVSQQNLCGHFPSRSVFVVAECSFLP